MEHMPINVLLVEDSPADARLVQEALRAVSSHTFKLTHVPRLDEGLRCLAKRRFDVVLLDLLLEDTPRLGTLMAIHGQVSKVPVIVLTGFEDETVRLWVLREGAKDYLVKGKVDNATLVRSIQRAIAKRTSGARHPEPALRG